MSKVPSPVEILEKYQHRLTENEINFLESLSEWEGNSLQNRQRQPKIFSRVFERDMARSLYADEMEGFCA